MAIQIRPDLEEFAEEQARRQGMRSASEWITQLVEGVRNRAAGNGQPAPAREWIERIRGASTSGLTTDEIMRMTRSEL